MMQPKPEALRMAGASEVLLEATKLLSSMHPGKHFGIPGPEGPKVPKLNLDWFISQYSSMDKCSAQNLPCDHSAKYRQILVHMSHSGWCNNLRNPEFGMSFRPFMYLLPPEYDDGNFLR
ncbi:hypothetical protein GCK32_018290 [Trichostrongylus colubriformis]|uniref:Uncharacterized protein n=1 Tax=Trichostrongylus colubriformis TaxID=6319 RepID=A0AAN8IZ58_TRICO